MLIIAFLAKLLDPITFIMGVLIGLGIRDKEVALSAGGVGGMVLAMFSAHMAEGAGLDYNAWNGWVPQIMAVVVYSFVFCLIHRKYLPEPKSPES